MRRFNFRLMNVDQTGSAMHALVMRYATDMAPYAGLPLSKVYEKIRNLPYTPDPRGNEFLHRPLATMNEWNAGTGLDCDDKAIAMAAWAQLYGIPWRIEIVGRGKRFHHVRVLLRLYGKWQVVDPTYRRNSIFRDNFTYRKRRVLGRGIYYHQFRRLFAPVQ